jgi:nucleoside-diphosphate kinase
MDFGFRSTSNFAVKDEFSMQRTLIIFKPDCVQRRLVGEILRRFETKGLRIAAMKLLQVPRELGEQHYGEHQGKPFFAGLIDFITGGPVVVGVLEGNEAISVVRTMLGATNGVAAAPGTIRGDFSISKQNNLIHGSDSPESAEREMALWFKAGEIVDYSIAGSQWVFDGA